MDAKAAKPDDDFRDHLATVDQEGKRKWIFPKKPHGYYTRLRTWLSWGLLALLFGGPFIRIQGEPLLLFNVLERKFVIFGQVFWPQDFHLFVFAMITSIVFIIVFTVVFGRLFCGWVCPQTIFMEMVFRKIEYWIDGDYKQQMKLRRAPWDAKKIWKRTLKHSIFLGISFLIGNTFLAYIIGSDALIELATEPVTQNLASLSSMLLFTGMFYGVFAWMREQVCTTICPYGRLQGVLLDRHSLVVAYDYIRGEGKKGRALFRKKEDRQETGKGDCIDCGQCVNVCPTGIDIRNGTQLECVNCTACMDACDEMMEAVDLQKGLIGYKTEEGITQRTPFQFTTRVKAYSAVLGVLIIALSAMLITRSVVETTILRTPGSVYQKLDEGHYSNIYSFKVINKTNQEFDVELKLEDHQGELEMIGNQGAVNAQGIMEGVLLIKLEKEHIDGRKTPLEIGVYRDGKRIETVKTNFMGPAA